MLLALTIGGKMKRIGEILDIVIEQNGVRSRGRFPFSKILESEHEKT